MDAKIRQLVSKSAGTYFVVTDNSQVATIEAEAKMRLFFINSDKGPTNVLVKFAKGDFTGFTGTYGKSTRLMEKRGNFSISVCLDALIAGPIAVINLRAYDDSLDKADVVGLNPNIEDETKQNVAYTSLFNTNKFWAPKDKNLPELLTGNELLCFGNIGNNNLSIFVTLATPDDVVSLTAEGNKTLKNSVLQIDEYPGLDFDMLVKDTFVNVYVFDNTFNSGTISTNKFYGQYFNNNGNVDLANLENLINVTEAGFVKKFTGSLIPNLVSENSDNISIDAVINATYMTYGLLSYLNHDVLEADNKYVLDIFGRKFFNDTDTKVALTSDYLLSYVVPATLTESAAVYPMTLLTQNVAPTSANLITYGCVKIDDKSFESSFQQGIRIGDKIKGILENTLVEVTAVETLNAAVPLQTGTYHKVKITCSGAIGFIETVTGVAPDQVTTYQVIKENLFTKACLIHPFDLTSYKPRPAQFTDGTASKQSEILDMMLNFGIVKGIKGTANLRYAVDCFKSFVESGYKYQFGSLMDSCDKSNRFMRSIINEPFLEDLEKSTNPLFKQTPGGVFDWSYLKTGGNTTYSTKLLTKFALGSNMCFFFGPGNIVSTYPKPISGLVSNLFFNKSVAYDVLANETGIVDNLTELETAIDDDDREFTEYFNYNAVINFNGANRIFANLTGQKENTSLRNIDHSELLCYIKESLYNLSKTEAFKKGNYDDYLRTQTETQNFMNGLALSGAVEPEPIVICDASNNTTEIVKQKIKLVHVEYTAINAPEKTIFDLVIN